MRANHNPKGKQTEESELEEVDIRLQALYILDLFYDFRRDYPDRRWHFPQKHAELYWVPFKENEPLSL